MKTSILLLGFCMLTFAISAQSIKQKLQTAFSDFESDAQLSHAISSLYIINAKTGEVVFDKNSKIGLAGASTQKIITATSAFEMLGKDYRYKTYVGYDIEIVKNELIGNLYVEGSGDPTLGSWRWETTKDSIVLKKILSALASKNIKKIRGDIWIDDLAFGVNPVPGGWIWDDIGNYYGAGSWGFNWRENQYDLVLKPGKNYWDITHVIKTNPSMYDYHLGNGIHTGEKNSGDNGYIYYTPYSNFGFSTGTVPAGVNEFTISGSMPHPAKQFGATLVDYLSKQKIILNNKVKIYTEILLKSDGLRRMTQYLDSLVSPSLDSVVYWFLKKSINLYGESLLRTIGGPNGRVAAADSGIERIKNFWKQKGLDPDELNIKDGSGLSPQNRITTHAQVEILKYAKQQSWFNSFYDALPEFNNMKMKSGTIADVKGYCGYQTSSDGNEYIFSFLVNNYNGRASTVVSKMYKVLDILK